MWDGRGREGRVQGTDREAHVLGASLVADHRLEQVCVQAHLQGRDAGRDQSATVSRSVSRVITSWKRYVFRYTCTPKGNKTSQQQSAYQSAERSRPQRYMCSCTPALPHGRDQSATVSRPVSNSQQTSQQQSADQSAERTRPRKGVYSSTLFITLYYSQA